MERGPPLPAAIPWATLAVLFVSALLVMSPALSTRLEFSAGWREAGEWWRRWTSSFVHYNAAHFVWNAVVLALAGISAERRWPGRVRSYYVVAPAVIGFTVSHWAPELLRYRGLSGVGTGLVLIFSWRAACERQWPIASGVFFLLVAKLVAEAISSRPLLARFEDPWVVPAPAAHFAGLASAGVILLVADLICRPASGPACNRRADTF